MKKKEGDQIKKGEILFLLETEKVTYEVDFPEVASLGLTEEEAKEKFDIQVGRFSFHGCAKAFPIRRYLRRSWSQHYHYAGLQPICREILITY